jgi:hypothetical protein
LLAAILALAGQIAFGAVLADAGEISGQSATFAAATFICGPETGSGHQVPAHHHAPAGTLNPLLLALAQSGTLLAPVDPMVAAPAAPALRQAPRPPARAPPSTVLAAAYPRGPPAPV